MESMSVSKTRTKKATGLDFDKNTKIDKHPEIKLIKNGSSTSKLLFKSNSETGLLEIMSKNRTINTENLSKNELNRLKEYDILDKKEKIINNGRLLVHLNNLNSSNPTHLRNKFKSGHSNNNQIRYAKNLIKCFKKTINNKGTDIYKNLDTIDKLDVTALFGGRFHHDGPFDACRPQRNKGVKAAPVLAFPVDSPNNSLKRIVNEKKKNHQIDLAFGNTTYKSEMVGQKASVKPTKYKTNLSTSDCSPTVIENENLHFNAISPDKKNLTESPNDFEKNDVSIVNFYPTPRSDLIHGSFTAGLGTCTFIDGTSAFNADDSTNNISENIVSRKKSFVSKLYKNCSSDSNKNSLNDSNKLYDKKKSNTFSETNLLLKRVKSLKIKK